MSRMKKAESTGENPNDVLAKLRELDADGCHEVLRPCVEKHIDSWDADVFEAIAVVEWEAGDETERLAADEQRRGLAGLGPFPQGVEDALAELGEEEEATIARVAIGSSATAGWVFSEELTQLGDAEIAALAEVSMLRWEALRRIEGVVFARLAVDWTNDATGGAARLSVGGEVEALLLGELGRAPSPRGVWITALALSERLVDRGVRWIEAFARGIEEHGDGVPGACRPATCALLDRLHFAQGRLTEVDRAPAAILRGALRDRWVLRSQLTAADVEARRDGVSAVEIAGATAGAALVVRCRVMAGAALGLWAEYLSWLGRMDLARSLAEAALAYLANLSLDSGDSDAAARHARDAVAILSALRDVRQLHAAHHTRARALAKIGACDAARDAFRAAITSLESWVRTIGDGTRRARLLEEALPRLQDAVSFLLNLEDPTPEEMEEAFDIAERAKARSLLQTIGSHDNPRQIPVELLQSRKELETRLRLLQDGRIQELSTPEPRIPMVEFFSAELTKLRTEHTRLLDDLAMRFPAYAAEEGLTHPLSVPEVQTRVVGEQGAALLEYFVTKEETFVWVIRRDSARVVRLGLGEQALVERVEPIIEPFRESSHAVLGVFPKDLRALARTVFDPLLPHLVGVRRLLIVPSGALHEVPFEMLVLRLPDEAGWEAAVLAERFGGPEYLVERFEVAYGLSATLLDPSLESWRAGDSPVDTPKPWAESMVAAFGDPLYEQLGEEPTLNAVRASGVSFSRLLGTREEVQAIRRHFAHTRSFVRSRARESAYRRHAPGADLVHLGCHGLVNRDQPAYSGVVLSPGRRKDEDALLQAYEISEIRLERRPPVVLSACQVAGGRGAIDFPAESSRRSADL